MKEAQSGLTDEKNFKHMERDLGLYTDEDGVIQCLGRTSEAVLEYQAKYPALLPGEAFQSEEGWCFLFCNIFTHSRDIQVFVLLVTS